MTDDKPQVAQLPMDCEEVRDDLYLFITNELEDEDSQRVCAHLIVCKDCRQALSEHVKLAGALKRTLPGITLRYYSRNN